MSEKYAFDSPPETRGGLNLRLLYIAIPGAVVLLAVIFVVVGMFRGGAQAPPQPQPVVLEKVLSRSLAPSFECVGQVEAEDLVELKARVNGFLVARNFQDGALVKKGQVLFQIEPDQYQAALDSAAAEVTSAQAQLDRATLDFNRQSDLYAKRSAPKADYDAGKAAHDVARAALVNAQARLNLARLNLEYASIQAPFDGQISDTPYSEGSLLGPESGVLATVVSLDPINVTFGISDKTLVAERARLGETLFSQDQWQVRLKLSENEGYAEAGRIVYMSPLVDRQTDTIKFKARFVNPRHTLLPGQLVVAVIEPTNPRKLAVVPKEAVMTDDQGRYVFVPLLLPAQGETPGRYVAEKRPVTLGDELESEYVVSEGLAEGEVYLRKGLMSGGAMMAAGSPINITNPELLETAAGSGQAPEAKAGAAPEAKLEPAPAGEAG